MGSYAACLLGVQRGKRILVIYALGLLQPIAALVQTLYTLRLSLSKL